MPVVQTEARAWALWRKVLFRFFFIYFLLYIAPWSWFSIVPGAGFILKYYDRLIEWAVINANANFFRVFNIKDVQQVFNGSGDRSYNWAENYLYLSLAGIGCIIWSVIDRKRKKLQAIKLPVMPADPAIAWR